MGGLDHACRCVVVARVASAVNVVSCAPCMRGILTDRNENQWELSIQVDHYLLPDDHILRWNVFSLAELHFAIDGSRVPWSWNP